jgi:glucose-6-phosphate 1-dehydrogenase
MSRDKQACDFTIFGVLGDLSRRKLIPSLYQLDKAGQLRDMVQNHLMQILTLVAMEPPVNLQGDSLRN